MLKRNDTGQVALEFYEKRRMWAEYCSTHAGVTDRAFRVGFWLSRRMNGDDQCCWYSVPRIAKEMNRSVRQVQYAIRELETAGVMMVVPSKGKANSYHLRAPFI
ncbi:helix-turn-helix domain-containing protein [Aureimonas fodinaquatilis]|uniref:Helix-turn-helix domain-containing protein n=1 Tax=Aureimonas fodinaquatilis TaxID=2565783 RepID=A0A5B0DYJ8_9HYPH|nr:helix-turn-helix domain-containing protein [Aureimonas fodinaquatilis]